jgi:hypothetical protein
LLQSEAVMLQKKYQPALRDGIKIAVDLVNSVKEDAKDGDVDVKVRIAPNETEITFGLDSPEDEPRFATIAHKALQIIASKYVDGEILTSTELESIRDSQSMKTVSSDELKDGEQQGQEVVVQEAETLHKRIMKLIKVYQTACKAQTYPKNTFKAGSGNYFVGTGNNFYIYPTDKIETTEAFDYRLNGKLLNDVLNDQDKHNDKNITRFQRLSKMKDTVIGGKEKALEKETDETKKTTLQFDITDLIDQKKEANEKLTAFSTDNTVLELKNLMGEAYSLELPNEKLAFLKNNSDKDKWKILAQYNNVNTKINVDETKSGDYDYGSNPIKIDEAKQFVENFPANLDNSHKSTVFVASLAAEPSRYSVAHITNLLLLNSNSTLSAESTPAPKYTSKTEGKPSEIDKSDVLQNGNNIHNHQSMTMRGSQPDGRLSSEYPQDDRIEILGEKSKPNKNVTNRDLNSLYNNEAKEHLKNFFEKNKAKSNDELELDFVSIIENYL